MVINAYEVQRLYLRFIKEDAFDVFWVKLNKTNNFRFVRTDFDLFYMFIWIHFILFVYFLWLLFLKSFIYQ